MKTLYTFINESLLGNIDNTLTKGDDAVEKLIVFGKRYRFTGATVGSASGSMFNKRVLDKLTNNLPYDNDRIKSGQFDKTGKVKKFANWLDHIKFEDLGITVNGNDADNNFRRELGIKLEQYCLDNDIFLTNVHLWVVSTNVTGNKNIDVAIGRTDKYSNSSVVRFHYEIS